MNKSILNGTLDVLNKMCIRDSLSSRTMTGERTKVPTEKGWERMKYQSTLLAVTNMERSKAFYCGLLGREVVADFGANVTLSGGITLQTLDTWKGFLNTQKVTLPNLSLIHI